MRISAPVLDALRPDGIAAPALAMSFSLAVHLVLVAISWRGGDARGPSRPVLTVERGDVAVTIRRSVAPSPAAPVALAAPRLPAPRVPAVEREAPAAAPARLAAPVPSRVRRADDAPQPVAPPEAGATLAQSEVAEPIPGVEGALGARFAARSGRPNYPPGCRARAHRPDGCEGRGVYEVEVDERGRVTAVRTIASAGCPDLDRSAELFFLRRARFVPGRDADGTPVPWTCRQGIRFRLEGAEVDGDR